MPVYFPPLKINQTYTVTNVTPNRTYDPTTSSTSMDKQTIATILLDLKAAGISQ